MIAEKRGKGQATKAERKDTPTLTFRVDVTSWDNRKQTFEVGPDGQAKKLDGPPPKGKKQ